MVASNLSVPKNPREVLESAESDVILLWRVIREGAPDVDTRTPPTATAVVIRADLTDSEWAIVEPMIPPTRHGDRKRSVNVREVLNGIFYVLWTGCQWKARPGAEDASDGGYAGPTMARVVSRTETWYWKS